jgi:AbrB family looped-hinge helix DNA binding protein
MTKHTKVSAKGQVVIPKDVRDRLHWGPGTELEVVDGPAGVMLRARPSMMKKLPFDEALARLRAVVDYKGPAGTDEDWKEAIDEMFRKDPQWNPPSS